MNTNNLINTWKNADLSPNTENPVAAVNISETALTSITGGSNSAGYLCTLSGECNSSGKSCKAAVGDIVDGIVTLFWG